ncbi:MAG: ankyrin repeat domain-containing protein [Bacteroidetes bacterium]|nr:ankyrin repeat domain-containing protein [Bacteroidota bacterium]
MKRTQFIKAVGGSTLLLSTTPLFAFPTPLKNDPQLDKELVHIFVGKAHSNMEIVKELLSEHPTLLNAAHDWNFGDFETALGAASHMGYKELARYLLDQGAQANIFTAALFGKIEIVRPMLEAFPLTLHAKGPHGFTLLHHAEQGGEDATEVLEYLRSLGATETKVKLY